MRRMSVVVIMLFVGLALARNAAAQSAVRPTIQHVSVREGSGVVIIAGAGFGDDPTVVVGGVIVPVLSGTDSQVSVRLPDAMLKASGTYRLILLDPVRQVGDGFVVAVHAGVVTPVNGDGEA